MSKDDETIIDQLAGTVPPAPPEPTAGNRLARLDAKYRAPERLAKLTPQHVLMAQYMVFGISSPVRARQLRVGVDVPLDFTTAADAARVRRRAARRAIVDPLFRAELAKQLKSFRESLAPEAIRTIAAIMNDAGQGLAADRTVQLKASTTLLGENASGGGGAQVNVNINNGIQSLTAGIVVRLPSTAKETPGETAKVVEGIELQAEPDHQFISADDGQRRVRRRVPE
ncbi:MAG: hypothetical protein WA733_10605 [Methylocystis sp.]